MENKIKKLFWNISNVIRGYHSQREMFDVFVSVFYLYYISSKYNADIRNIRVNKEQLKSTNITKEELEVLDAMPNNKPNSIQNKSLSNNLNKVARLGGYMNRALDSPPGNIVM